MLDAAVKALSQILSPPMRSILWRSIGLALVLIVVLAVGLQRLLSWFAVYGEDWAEAMLGSGFHTPLNILAWIVSIAAGLGVVLGAVFLMPAITSLVASVFVDEVADHVEREHYPAERPGTALPFGLAMTVCRHRMAVGPGIFRAGGDAVSQPRGSQGDAQAERGNRVHRRACDRGVRIDPDRQPGDAAVRHGVHGSHAQAALRPAAGIDRAGAEDERAGGVSERRFTSVMAGLVPAIHVFITEMLLRRGCPTQGRA